MIKFNNLNQEIPYQLLKKKYDEAFDSNQKGIEAISISSFMCNHKICLAQSTNVLVNVHVDCLLKQPNADWITW